MTTDRVRVWDGFVRLFHWSLVALIAGAWLTADGPKVVHERMGYVIAALIGARVVLRPATAPQRRSRPSMMAASSSIAPSAVSWYLVPTGTGRAILIWYSCSCAAAPVARQATANRGRSAIAHLIRVLNMAGSLMPLGRRR